MPSELVSRAVQFHPWDAMAPLALQGIENRAPFRCTAETGCGGSTIILSQLSRQHTAFAIEGPNLAITEVRGHSDFRSDTVMFIEGETRHTVPVHLFEGRLDLVLLDGPHAYPLPQLEYVYLFPQVKVGGWLVLDDLQIPSVHELFHFLRREPALVLEEVTLRTAFFRKTAEFDYGPDGWQQQGINRHTLLRYSWRDRLRRILGRRGKPV